MLEIDIETNDDHSVCRPQGELDAYTVGQFREALHGLSDQQRVIIDLCPGSHISKDLHRVISVRA